MELHLIHDGESVFSIPIGARPVQVGRAPVNDVVLNDASVSQYHAVLWREEGGVRVRDLGSRNGVTVDGVRMAQSALVGPGARIGLGDTVLEIREATARRRGIACPLLLEDRSTRLCFALGEERLFFDAAGHPVVAASETRDAVAALVVEGGEAWLDLGETLARIDLDTPFEVCGRSFAVRHVDDLEIPTAVNARGLSTVHLSATLDGPTGAEAVLRCERTGLSHTVNAENRVVFLFLLARQFAADVAAGVPARRCGWCFEGEVLTGIWGRSATDMNKLDVLIYRLRKELREAGFDPWFLEKRSRYVRAAVATASVSG